MSAIASMADIGGTVGGSKNLGATYEAGRWMRGWAMDAGPGAGYGPGAGFTTVASFLITPLVCTIQHVI